MVSCEVFVPVIRWCWVLPLRRNGGGAPPQTKLLAPTPPMGWNSWDVMVLRSQKRSESHAITWRHLAKHGAYVVRESVVAPEAGARLSANAELVMTIMAVTLP